MQPRAGAKKPTRLRTERPFWTSSYLNSCLQPSSRVTLVAATVKTPAVGQTVQNTPLGSSKRVTVTHAAPEVDSVWNEMPKPPHDRRDGLETVDIVLHATSK